MGKINFLLDYLRITRLKNPQLYAVSLMMFFWAIFDGIMSFAAPLIITDMGLSETVMGLLIGSSSIAGVIFDLMLCRVLKNTNFRRMYLLMLIACSFYPLLLWQAKTVWVYLIAMAVWGLYYDFHTLGYFDFISRYTKKQEHTASFGVTRIFNTLGYLIAPIIAGFLIGEVMNFSPFFMAWIFLGISAFFYLILVALDPKKTVVEKKPRLRLRATGFAKELYLWARIGNLIFPVLLLTFFLNIIDSYFWTIGPIISESLFEHDGWGSLFMTTGMLPSLMIGWFIGKLTNKLGKKRTAIFSLFIGSAIFTTFYFIQNPIYLILINFVASFFIAVAWPSINGAYADYISEAPHLEKEIETIQDSSTNLGYVFGPIIAGFSAQYIGELTAFAGLGILGMLVALLLIVITPRRINIKVK